MGVGVFGGGTGSEEVNKFTINLSEEGYFLSTVMRNCYIGIKTTKPMLGPNEKSLSFGACSF